MPESRRCRVRKTFPALIVTVALVGGIAGLFVVDLGSATPDPVDFDETVTVGLTLEAELRLEAEEDHVELPRTQVFYSQYPYVVGYYGVEQFVVEQRQDAHEQRFGYPNAVYVTVYDDTSVSLTDDGFPAPQDDVDWYLADEAVYVVDSDARTPAGETAIPFASSDAAAAFVEEYSGTVHSWEELLETSFDVDDATAVRDRVESQHAGANERVAEATALLDRPVSVTVGEDVETIQEGIDTAPSGSTVVVPEGIHQERLEIDKPVTVRGEGAHLIGDGNSTVVNVTADEVALHGLTISGIGEETPGAAATDGHDHDHGTDDTDDSPDAEDVWDAAIQDDYATGDAGVAVDSSTGVLFDSILIHTRASGLLLRDSPDVVVRNVTVDGREDYVEAHMGVVAMRSPGVVENSTFRQGLDGVYTHRADGIVVRNNTMVDNRMGVHMMHTSAGLIADNTISGQESTGIFVMTGPERNGLVGNHIFDSPTGIDIGGSDSYVADNVLEANAFGLRIETASSVFEGNLVVDNDFGVSTWALLPTNRVAGNDFVGNDRHVARSAGPLRIWTHEGVGNYWEGAVGTTDGTVLDRQYTATDAIDSRLHTVDGTQTIAQSPAVDALAGFEGTVGGMRDGEIIDTAPLCEPVNEDWFEQRGRTDLECGT